MMNLLMTKASDKSALPYSFIFSLLPSPLSMFDLQWPVVAAAASVDVNAWMTTTMAFVYNRAR